MKLGTIMPTINSIKAMERTARNDKLECERIAGDNGLDDLLTSVVCGEKRYWRNKTEYAIVGRKGNVMWFEVREDGEYRI